MLLKNWEEYGVTLNSDEEFGEDGYPTDLGIAVILLWPIHDYPGLMSFIESIWWAADWGWHHDPVVVENNKTYHISTGGWSGNETLIRAMKDNYMFWTLCWEQSRRGGHYIFEVPVNL